MRIELSGLGELRLHAAINPTNEAREEQEGKERRQPCEEVFRFHKLNLMNSPNIIVYDDCPLDLNEEEPPSAIKPSLKMNRSRLEHHRNH